MPESSFLRRTGATPGKLALIGALAVVLVSILAYQFVGSSVSSLPSIEDDTGPKLPRSALRGAAPVPVTPVASTRGAPSALASTPSSSSSSSSPSSSSSSRPAALAPHSIAGRRDVEPPLEIVLRHDPFRGSVRLFGLEKPDVGMSTTPSANGNGASRFGPAGDAMDATEDEGPPILSAEELAANVGRLRESGVSVIIGEGDHAMAVLGAQVLRVGDFIDGLQVTEIRRDGTVVLEQPPGETTSDSANEGDSG